MTAPLFAGFEGAQLHWNGHDCLIQTRHTPDADMAGNYVRAIAAGAVGFRDALPTRFDPWQRYAAGRVAAGDRLIVWDLVHFDRPADPVGHARRVAALAGPQDRLVAVCEPSSAGMTGMSREAGVVLAGGMMGAGIAANSDSRWWVCDPAHDTSAETWAATDALVEAFGRHIEVIGLNYHSCWAVEPLRDVLRHAAGRYPRHRLALTETSHHEGHPDARWGEDRAAWWRHVQAEIDESGVDLVCACYAPWLNMSFEPGEPWPNGWPAAA